MNPNVLCDVIGRSLATFESIDAVDGLGWIASDNGMSSSAKRRGLIVTRSPAWMHA